MLTPDEETAFRESIARVARLAKDHLSRATDARSVVAFVANLHRSVDQVATMAAQLGPLPECRAGCFYCCSVRVEASEPEVFRIAGWLKAQSPERVSAVIEALRKRLGESDPATDGGKRYCSFLVDGLCSIYEVRPATCHLPQGAFTFSTSLRDLFADAPAESEAGRRGRCTDRGHLGGISTVRSGLGIP